MRGIAAIVVGVLSVAVCVSGAIAQESQNAAARASSVKSLASVDLRSASLTMRNNAARSGKAEGLVSRDSMKSNSAQSSNKGSSAAAASAAAHANTTGLKKVAGVIALRSAAANSASPNATRNPTSLKSEGSLKR